MRRIKGEPSWEQRIPGALGAPRAALDFCAPPGRFFQTLQGLGLVLLSSGVSLHPARFSPPQGAQCSITGDSFNSHFCTLLINLQLAQGADCALLCAGAGLTPSSPQGPRLSAPSTESSSTCCDRALQLGNAGKIKFQVLPKPLNARPNPGNPPAILLAI